ncbi:CHAT domain-containing protein [Actinophytocola algeriensis]|uniref:CHAT domain-containing protein n=1 Tax=Actinophytocola algeriensis TaxID=1768010 RepID=A0A7W7VF57_9PSEU|nr:CHAT domain-containing protein [Actinophytocola algeriensis]MBB4907962.1 hypothetical protein [Actinophytocola algeriensis]MBE1479992.1 hypothetical protein [Actinophytocola algeriensis]
MVTTVQIKFVDAGHLYVTWRWEHALGEPRVAVADPAGLPLAELAAALPTPLPGESVRDALGRALAGPLLDRKREQALAEGLARGLFPAALAAELNAYLSQGVRVHLRIQPAPSIAQVPWEALRLSAGERLVHVADVSVLAPASVRNAAGRTVSTWDPSGSVVGVLDPRVPGFADDSELGSVLGPVSPALLDLGARSVPGGFRREDITRDVLESLLVLAGRFLYVGHVTTAAHGLDARLHLCCGAGTSGRAELVGAHRPLTAADIALGHGSARPWRIPNRVALIACESGGDARFAEPSGLVAAMVHGGAEYVTSTRWTLPTDAVLPGFGSAVVAVDGAHTSADPVAGVGLWQRGQADLWDRDGEAEASPILWGAFSTAYAP